MQNDRIGNLNKQRASSVEANQPPSRKWVTGCRARVLLCASGVSFMIMLDSNIVAVSLPAIARSLNATFDAIEWVVSAYVLTFAALLMPAGALADRFGRKRLLLSGLAIFTVASVLCGVAPTAVLLNAGRALQGVGAALQLSAALAVLGHEFRGAERVRAFAFWGTVLGIAVAIGPLVGGVITSAFGWRWAFLVNLPVGAGLIFLAATAVKESCDPDARRLDVAGMVTFGAGLACIVWSLISSTLDGWSYHATQLKLGAGAVLLVLFVIIEKVQKRPMVDFDLFRKRTYLGSAFAMFGFASAAQVMMTYLPLYLQNTFGQSPAVAGLAMLPFALPLFFCPRIGAALSERISGRAVLTIGLSLVAIGNCATAMAAAQSMHYFVIAFGMFLTGCGAGLLNGETTKVSMSVVPPERGGMASGIAATLRFVGLVVGITALGAILANRTEQHLVKAMPASMLSGSSVHSFASRIIGGDMAGALQQIPDAARPMALMISRDSFSSGFASVLLVAALIAAVTALLSWVLVSAAETKAPSPQAVPAETSLPKILD